ncbi:hypothetical protein [Deinococcus aquatilis]|uniref:hypothetical protein n=1 Tax=Deinococcus aquatilis TaxID=519440 RepID=UPI00035E3E8A|nr:hypothetical protein [Deinococcus aquatilis]
MKRILAVAVLLLNMAEAVTVTDALRSIRDARREVIAVLPGLMREDMATALKATSARGTRVFVITRESSVRSGGYLLTVSHAPGALYTYLIAGEIPVPWVLVDGAWAVSGRALDQEGAGSVEVTRAASKIAPLQTWAREVTKPGPVSRVDVLKRRYAKN